MPDHLLTRKALDVSVDRFRYMVFSQEVFISTLKQDDRRLQDACLLLRQLKQNLATSELGQAIREYELDAPF